MPLLKFDLIEGRSEAEIRTLLDGAHRAMLAAFEVPERDRYQIVTEHAPSRMIVEDTGLGHLPHRQGRLPPGHEPQAQEEAEGGPLSLLCEELEKSCGIAPSRRGGRRSSRTPTRTGRSAGARRSSSPAIFSSELRDSQARSRERARSMAVTAMTSMAAVTTVATMTTVAAMTTVAGHDRHCRG